MDLEIDPEVLGIGWGEGIRKHKLAMSHGVTKGWADRMARGEVGTEAAAMAEDPG